MYILKLLIGFFTDHLIKAVMIFSLLVCGNYLKILLRSSDSILIFYSVVIFVSYKIVIIRGKSHLDCFLTKKCKMIILKITLERKLSVYFFHCSFREDWIFCRQK